ncbi:hypothetical protein OPQ81_009657 [Rhizoctonia solani]|nr:hypothetical protein OPQ81_009657 [Rhizoctonia solani]
MVLEGDEFNHRRSPLRKRPSSALSKCVSTLHRHLEPPHPQTLTRSPKEGLYPFILTSSQPILCSVPSMAESSVDGADQSSLHKSDGCVIEHCYYAFDTLYCALTRAEPVDMEKFEQYLKGDFPLFVTWNTVSSRLLGGVRLRGCIGNFEAMSLDEGIKEYALISAFRDHRFRPIEEKELRKLECVVSLLTDFEDAESYLDWEVGTHGIYITLQLPIIPVSSTDTPSAPSPISSSTSSPRPSARQRRLTATYLPDVIPAQGWSKQEAVDSALRKAGFDGRITEEVRRAVKLRRYQSSVCSARWEEYWAWRQEWADTDK